ncbi:MAG: ribonuclease HI family protein [Nitrososphaerota archaeon]
MDGAARGNPGHAGVGVVLVMDGVVRRFGEYVGVRTNNEAEYVALIKGLELALEMGFRETIFYSDSQLLVRQIRGEYKVRSKKLMTLYGQAVGLISALSSFKIVHVERVENSEADRLANQAIDKKLGRFRD